MSADDAQTINTTINQGLLSAKPPMARSKTKIEREDLVISLREETNTYTYLREKDWLQEVPYERLALRLSFLGDWELHERRMENLMYFGATKGRRDAYHKAVRKLLASASEQQHGDLRWPPPETEDDLLQIVGSDLTDWITEQLRRSNEAARKPRTREQSHEESRKDLRDKLQSPKWEVATYLGVRDDLTKLLAAVEYDQRDSRADIPPHVVVL